MQEVLEYKISIRDLMGENLKMDLMQWNGRIKMVSLRATAQDVLSAAVCNNAAPDQSLSRRCVWAQGAGCQRVRNMARLQQTQLLCSVKCRRRAGLNSPVRFKEQSNELSLRSSVALFFITRRETTGGPASARCCSHKGNMQEAEIKMLENA